MIYNIVFGAATVFGALSLHRLRDRQVIYYFILLVFFFMTAFRWEVGCDFYSYRRMSLLGASFTVGEAISRSESGFWLTALALDQMGLQFPAINVFAAGIMFLGIHAMAKRQPDPLAFLVLSFPVLIMNIGMSGIRQGIAVGFLCYAFNAFLDKKRLSFILFVLLGYSYHSSAIAFLAFYPFLSKSKYKDRILFSALLSLPLIIYFAQSDVSKTYIEMYVDNGDQAAGATSRASLLLLTGALFLFYLRPTWTQKSPDDSEFLTLSSVLMILMYPLAIYSSVMGDRFGYYLIPAQLIIQSKAYLFFKNKNTSLLLYAYPFIVGGFSLFIWSQFSQLFNQCWMPYNIWWTVD